MGKQKEQHLLSLAGEFRVCSELFKRGIYASLTLGNLKGVDIFIFDETSNKTKSIEVKTTKGKNFITSLFQKYKTESVKHPDYWVFYSVQKKNNNVFEEDFYILKHEDVIALQKKMNKTEHLSYSESAEKVKKGVDNIKTSLLLEFKDNWDLLTVTR